MMLQHHNNQFIKPNRVVIIGAAGFVGSTTLNLLTMHGIPCLGLCRQELDLNQANAAQQLAQRLRSDDALVVIAAKAPCKNYSMLYDNIQMMKAVCDALTQQSVQHVIYISSDAVYADSMDKLHERSLAAPTSLHGVMHLAREQMLQSVVDPQSLAILRPSLLYGANDPHNGYGPNRFYRLAMAGQDIELFGEGEEQRDHVYIEDVARVIHLCLMHRSYGVLNVTTGHVMSFAEIANLIKTSFKPSLLIKSSPRVGAMPHNGYRAFDNATCKQTFTDFKYTLLPDGIQKMHQDALT